MTDLLVFGADSLVGSHFVSTTRHNVTAAGERHPEIAGLRVAEFIPADLRRPDDIENIVRRSPVEVVVNFAAATNVDAVEKERPVSLSEPVTSESLIVNAIAPEAMASATRATGKILISVSTDFVFDGTAGPYPESAHRDPFSPLLSWYGWTKGEGERRIEANDPTAMVIRIAYPYRVSYSGKLDFARRIVEQYRQHTLPPLFSDQQMTPTWIPDVSRAVEHLVDHPDRGVFHVASPEVTSPLEFAKELLSALDQHPPELVEGSLRNYLSRSGATPRPVRGGLQCSRLPGSGISLTDWHEGIRRFVEEGGGAR